MPKNATIEKKDSALPGIQEMRDRATALQQEADQTANKVLKEELVVFAKRLTKRANTLDKSYKAFQDLQAAS